MLLSLFIVDALVFGSLLLLAVVVSLLLLITIIDLVGLGVGTSVGAAVELLGADDAVG